MRDKSAIVLVAVLLSFGGVAVYSAMDPHLPGNHQGYEPTQPIAFSHRLHAGELEMDCLYCHSGAERSRHAGIPPASLCMNCHRFVTASWDEVQLEKERASREKREPIPVISDALAPLFSSLGLGDDLNPDASIKPRPIPWVKVHHLPDFVYFDHRVHVSRGVACETCHGPVQSMERVRQESDLSMGWCIECHRRQPRERGERIDLVGERRPDHVSTDCASCHY